MKIKLLNGDALELLGTLDDKSVDLVLTDPPYNIAKAKWDKWKTQEEYVEWCGKWFLECQRVLKDNGSMYFFHNDMVQIAMLMEWIRKNTAFVFKQFIVWNKRFKDCDDEFRVNATLYNESLRNYKSYAEYCLFYTFQDKSGASAIHSNRDCFRSVKDFLLQERAKLGMSTKQLIDKSVEFLDKRNTGISHYFTDSQFTIPTEEVYKNYLQVIGKEYCAFTREYEDLREEYERLRYTFNNQKSHHSVWNYNIQPSKLHPTQKPIILLENILLHSSNEGDVVLDCFMGSGSTGVAAVNLNRDFIGIERDEQYFEIAKDRINQVKNNIIES